MKPHEMNAVDAAAAMRRGDMTAEALVQSCLDCIAEREPAVDAWAYLDPDYVLAQARDADAARAAGGPLGGLHGLPVAVKDIFDTADMPTENGTPLHAGRTPSRDAFVVALLRAAGAVIMGKTVTTEFAVAIGGKTRNPHGPERTPGGSSSGSAAAVAAAMVPLSIGTQTSGSVLRPAAFCGVYGYKPTHGLISRGGILPLSALDQVGVFARDLADTALIAETIMAYDPDDPSMRPCPRPALLAAAEADPPAPPSLAFVRSPMWTEATPDTRSRFDKLVARLGDHVSEVELPAAFDDAVALHKTISWTDIAMNLGAEYDRGADGISPLLRSVIEEGRAVRAVDYASAIKSVPSLMRDYGTIFAGFDAILTPATIGEAPLLAEGTGSPIFLALWTLLGAPAINVPGLNGPTGLPIGVQLVGAHGHDGRLLRAARWLGKFLAERD